jgi:hypothetical protein
MRERLNSPTLLTASFRQNKIAPSLIILSIAIICLLSTNIYAADQWDPSDPAGTANASDLDALIIANNNALDRFLSYGRHDCVISYSSASAISVGTGSIVCSNSGGTVRRLRVNTSATSVGWSDIDSGSENSSTTYYIFACADADATTFTIKVTTNSSVPTGITYYRRLGYFYNDSSSNITQIVNDDDIEDIAFVKGQGNYYKIDSGSVSISPRTSSAVSFTFTFASTPIVVIGKQYDSASNDDPAGYTIDAKNITTTGFNAWNSEPSITVIAHWVAIGQVLTQ